MKIIEVQVCDLQPPDPEREGAAPRRASWTETFKQATPMDKFADPNLQRREPGGVIWVKIVAEDGSYGLGMADTGHVAAILIKESLADLIIGQEVGAIDRCNDLMWRGTLSFGNEGLTARAIAGMDLALWDLWGKVVDQPVYKLAGGAQREEMEVYTTGNDLDWAMELGFSRFKLARPYGVTHGQAGIDGTAELMDKTRALIGPEADLMLDCWMAYDADYAVQMCEALRPYRMRWMEEMLMPHGLEGVAAGAPARAVAGDGHG
ncbi:MAG: enolase C-terminal domain-like protein [Candidatus Latescibacterota bacterium]|jgi:L-rhamnonate dehydratase